LTDSLYAKADATEIEGECTANQADSGAYHYDSSVEVCGSDGDDDNCDCSIDCECDSCYSCDDCGHREDNCNCNGCMRCHDCEEDQEDCECDIESAFDPECDDCKEESKEHVSKVACLEHRVDKFFDHASACCLRIGNASMECDYDCGCEVDHNCGRTQNRDGEMVSPPLPTRELSQWIRDNYPVRTNTSCGAHRHRSFKNIKYYSILMDRQFNEYLITRLKAWGHKVGVREGSALFRRLNGEVHWCKKEYDGYQQISTSSKEDCRYRIVNYCWKLHTTVEIRVLPAFQDVELTVSAHKELGDIMDEFISQNINSLQPRRRVQSYP